MSLIAVVAGSPAPASRALAVAEEVADFLERNDFLVGMVNVRDLPAEALLWREQSAPEVHAAMRLLANADSIVLVTPVYNAAYSAALKALLDLLPQLGLAGKVVLPIAIGGSLAHVLAIDYSLRPVLAAMGGPHVLSGVFLLDEWMKRGESGALIFDDVVRDRLRQTLDELVATTQRRVRSRSSRPAPPLKTGSM